MADILLNRNVSPSPDIPFNISMHGLPPATSSSDSQAGRIYYRFEDEPTEEPRLWGKVTAGFSLDVPIDLKGRLIRLFMGSETKKGVLSTQDFAKMEQIVFDPGAQIIAGEDILTNQLLHYYNDSGVTKAELADATDATKPCQAFAANDALTGVMRSIQ